MIKTRSRTRRFQAESFDCHNNCSRRPALIILVAVLSGKPVNRIVAMGMHSSSRSPIVPQSHGCSGSAERLPMELPPKGATAGKGSRRLFDRLLNGRRIRRAGPRHGVLRHHHQAVEFPAARWRRPARRSVAAYRGGDGRSLTPLLTPLAGTRHCAEPPAIACAGSCWADHPRGPRRSTHFGAEAKARCYLAARAPSGADRGVEAHSAQQSS